MVAVCSPLPATERIAADYCTTALEATCRIGSHGWVPPPHSLVIPYSPHLASLFIRTPTGSRKRDPLTAHSSTNFRCNEVADASSARTTRSPSSTTPTPPRPTWPRCTKLTMPTRRGRLQNPTVTEAVAVAVVVVVAEQGRMLEEQRRRQARESSVEVE